MTDEPPSELFPRVGEEEGPMEIESLCMNCHENGTTRLLLTKIPNFREIIVMAFQCPHCGYKSNEVQSAGEIAEKGCKHTLRVTAKEDLNRQIIKTDSASVIIPELDFEIPPNTQKGVLSTVEGVLRTAADNLKTDQEHRRQVDPAVAAKIDDIVRRLERCAEGEEPFTFILDDPSGRSIIQSLCHSQPDPAVRSSTYERSVQQNVDLGLATSDEAAAADMQKSQPTASQPQGRQPKAAFDMKMLDKVLTDEVQLVKDAAQFSTQCSSCSADGQSRMVLIDIPHFKEVVLMSFVCDACGNRSNEIKTGGVIPPQATRLTLKCLSRSDLTRDVLKSDTAGISIPELELELQPGTLGGKFTTVEGLLTNVQDQLTETMAYMYGDSSDEATRNRFVSFMVEMGKVVSGEVPFTLVLEDPLSNSFIEKHGDPDPNLQIELFDRTHEQNDDLGLNDIKTEGYSEDH